MLIHASLLVAALAVLAALSGTALAQTGDSQALDGTVRIGALVPLSGDGSANGADVSVSLELAEAAFNRYLQESGVEWTLDITVEDTSTSPVVALEKLTGLKAKGISAVVGTYSSAELHNVKGYADSNEMLLISFGSTSPSLAIPGDSIYRFVPDDTKQAPAIARLLAESGITNVIPIWREDVWGNGLMEETRASFTGLGGVVDAGIGYNPKAAEFSVAVSLLSDLVARHIDDVGADRVAVLIVSFSEITNLAQTASEYDNLDQVRWFGTSAIAKESSLADDPIASRFLATTGLAATQFAASDNPRYEAVRTDIVEIVGREPVIYAFTAYDAVWAIGLSILATGSTDASPIAAALPGVLEDYDAALGRIVLNEAGDLDKSIYEVWQLGESGWHLESVYDPESDSIIRDGGPALIPGWIAGLFKLYAEGQIDDGTLIQALQFLISEGIIQLE